MTLDTRLRIVEPVNPFEVFRFCQSLLSDEPDKQEWRANNLDYEFSRPGFSNAPMQGLPGWLFVYCGDDGGPLRRRDCIKVEYPDDGETCEPGELCFGCREPEGYVEISIDTAYGYTDPDTGAGCGDLHAAFIEKVGQWAEARDLTWYWYNEFTGEWHLGREGLEELGSGAKAAEIWFRNIALPAILNDVKERSNGS